jgi:DNA repair protein RecO (recombination protein O)
MLIEAIVIKRVSLREHDQLVTLYSRELGKISAVAKSALKPHSVQALQLDAGNTIHCELVDGRGGPIITGAQAFRCLSSAKASVLRWAAAQFFLQVIDTVVYDHQQDQALFTCLTETLSALDTAPDDQVLSVYRRQQEEMLQVLGYGRPSRTEIDNAYERIAQRRLPSLALVYELAGRRNF